MLNKVVRKIGVDVFGNIFELMFYQDLNGSYANYVNYSMNEEELGLRIKLTKNMSPSLITDDMIFVNIINGQYSNWVPGQVIYIGSKPCSMQSYMNVLLCVKKASEAAKIDIETLNDVNIPVETLLESQEERNKKGVEKKFYFSLNQK